MYGEKLQNSFTVISNKCLSAKYNAVARSTGSLCYAIKSANETKRKHS